MKPLRIGIITTWNVACGAGVLAETLVREWIRVGHEVTVLAPIEPRRPLTRTDEPYVIRCYYLESDPNYREKPLPKSEMKSAVDDRTFHDQDFDVFLINNLEIMPTEPFLPIFDAIRKKGTLMILIIHEGGLPKDRFFYAYDFDGVICFDDRYTKRWVSSVYEKSQIHIIPFPVLSMPITDKYESRKILGLPLEKKIIFNYGINVHKNLHLIPSLSELSKRYELVFLTITEVGESYELFEALKSKYPFIELMKGPIDFETMHRYLNASDAMLMHKDYADATVVSSTVFMCMSSNCPIVTSDTNFVEGLHGEVLKYNTLDEMRRILENIFNGAKYTNDTIRKAHSYASINSSQIIARKYLKLFDKLMGQNTSMSEPFAKRACGKTVEKVR
jgi:glycosyltransferase involved in cell wall biosynthesis